MRKTSAIEKVLTSMINVVAVFFICLPLLKFLSINEWKIAVIVIFFLYNLFFLIFNQNRCLGMIIMGTRWDKRVSFNRKLLFIILYTLSFSTLLFLVWFPFDIFLANMLLLQLPSILITGTTFHGYLSGDMCSMIQTKNK